MDKTVIKHSLIEDPFTIPMRIRKRLPIQKNIFELREPELKRINGPQLPMKQQCHISDPLVMDSALIKSLLFGKMQTYLILISLIVSCFLVYQYGPVVVQDGHRNEGKLNDEYQSIRMIEENKQDQQFGYKSQAIQYLLLLQTFISFLLVSIIFVGHYYENQSNKTRGLQTNYIINTIKLVTFILHPNIWMEEVNFLLHLFLVIRLPFMFSYWIKTSTYHNNRSFRLTEIYGIKPSENFFFAIKSIVDQMMIQQIVMVYVFIVFLFTHALYLAGLSQISEAKSFWSCFQVIIVTLPTIGYGQYEIVNLMQRGIILLAVVVGACMNSLITLIMLRQFEMSTQETFSYNLLQKINLKQRMEHISRQYIVTTVQDLRSKKFSTLDDRREYRRQIDNNFKEEYKYLKTHYTEINTRDLNSMFNLFKQQLKQFRISFEQMNNLVFVLLAKLKKVKPTRKKNGKS